MARSKFKFDAKALLVTAVSGTVGFIAGNKVPGFIPVGSDKMKAVAVTAAGGVIAVKGVQKKNAAVTAFGTGMAAAGGVKLVNSFAAGGILGIDPNIMITGYQGRNLPNAGESVNLGQFEFNEMQNQ